MTKKIKKTTKKPVAKKVVPKKKDTKQNVSLTVRVRQEPTMAIATVSQQSLDPIKEAGKYTMTPTWISEKQVIKILQRTPPEHVFTRKAKGGGDWEYVTGNYVIKALNFIFSWNWDFEIIKQEIVGTQVVTLGKLTVKDGKTEKTVTKTQNGRADIKFKKDSKEHLDIGNDFKASATDCLKKCASMLGIASDIYGRQEFRDIGVAVKNDQPAPAPVQPQAPKVVTAEVVKTESNKTSPFNDDDEWCVECANPLTKAEADYSQRIYKKKLCRGCQSIIKQQR